MKKVTIKAYAVSHKLSIFNVMKMVKSGKLQSEVIEESGKEVTYIIVDEQIEEDIKAQIIPLSEKKEVQLTLEVAALKKELNLLKKEIQEIKKRI
jgi:vacuolar-type H+-ATPase subunit F/Vma7